MKTAPFVLISLLLLFVGSSLCAQPLDTLTLRVIPDDYPFENIIGIKDNRTQNVLATFDLANLQPYQETVYQVLVPAGGSYLVETKEKYGDGIMGSLGMGSCEVSYAGKTHEVWDHDGNGGGGIANLCDVIGEGGGGNVSVTELEDLKLIPGGGNCTGGNFTAYEAEMVHSTLSIPYQSDNVPPLLSPMVGSCNDPKVWEEGYERNNGVQIFNNNGLVDYQNPYIQIWNFENPTEVIFSTEKTRMALFCTDQAMIAAWGGCGDLGVTTGHSLEEHVAELETFTEHQPILASSPCLPSGVNLNQNIGSATITGQKGAGVALMGTYVLVMDGLFDQTVLSNNRTLEICGKPMKASNKLKGAKPVIADCSPPQFRMAFDNSQADREAEEARHIRTGTNVYPTDKTVWARFIAPASGSVLIQTRATGAHQIAVFKSDGEEYSDLTLVATDAGSGADGEDALIFDPTTPLRVEPFAEYAVMINSFDPSSAEGTLIVQAVEGIPIPNDDLCNATHVRYAQRAANAKFKTGRATIEANEPLPNDQPTPQTVWYKVDPPSSGAMQVNLLEYGGNPVARVFAAPRDCRYAAGIGPALSSEFGPGDTITVYSIPPTQEVYIQVSSSTPASGELQLAEVLPPGGGRSRKVQTLQAEQSFAVYPNPFSESLSFTHDVTQVQTLTLEIFDLTGKRVLERKENVAVPQSGYTMEISGENLPGGLLFYRFSSVEGIFTGKVVQER